MKQPSLTRRTFLRGAAGAALALPLLQLEKTGLAQTTGFPKRVVFFFMPEGVQTDYWWPELAESETNFAFGPSSSMQPLEDIKSVLSVIRGLDHESTKGISGCYHGFGMKHVLTGGPNSPGIEINGVTTPPGISFDRFLGKHIQGVASLPSYELGVRSKNINTTEQRQLSFDSKDVGREAESSPYLVFQQLLGGETLATSAELLDQIYARRQSILDLLREDIARVRCRLGSSGREHLDAHLEGIFALEQRLAALKSQAAASLELDPVDESWSNADQYNAMSNFPVVGKLQMDMLALALASDMVRVGLLQWSTTVSGISFPWLGLNLDSYHHAIGHSQESSDLLKQQSARQDIRNIATWYVQQYRYFIDKLASIPEGEGTLLDNTAVVFFSDMSFANSHSPNNLPIILAGGLGGTLRTGQYLQLSEQRPFADLLITLANALGIGISAFGEPGMSSGPIESLLA